MYIPDIIIKIFILLQSSISLPHPHIRNQFAKFTLHIALYQNFNAFHHEFIKLFLFLIVVIIDYQLVHKLVEGMDFVMDQ